MTTTASAIEVRSLGTRFGETGPLVLDDGAWSVIPNAEGRVLGVEACGIPFTGWTGWLTRDAHERALGDADESAVTRERVKVVPRQERVSIAWDSVLSAR